MSLMDSICLQAIDFLSGRLWIGLGALDMSSQGFLFLLILVVISAICWSIGRPIYKYSRYGFLVSIIVGFAGAFLGRWIARVLHLPWMFPVGILGQVFPVVWSTMGGAVLVATVSIVSKRLKKKSKSR